MVKNFYKIIFFLVLFLSLGFIKTSYSDFTCNIDSEVFTAADAYWLESVSVGSIVASSPPGPRAAGFLFQVAGPFEVRTYALESYPNYCQYNTPQLILDPFFCVSQSGTLTITSKTADRLQGEFDVTLICQAGQVDPEQYISEVTNGSFDLPIRGTTTTSIPITTSTPTTAPTTAPTTSPTTSPTTAPTTTPTTTPTTIPTTICPSEVIYGEQSEQVETLRYLRDNVLKQTAEGRRLIKLYYLWSPFIVKAMNDDEEFKAWVKETIDSVLPMIESAVE